MDTEQEGNKQEENKDLESFKRVHLLPEFVPGPSSGGGGSFGGGGGGMYVVLWYVYVSQRI